MHATAVQPGAGRPEAPVSPTDQLLPHLALVRRVVRGVARRHALTDEDRRELLGETLLKLMTDNCAVLRSYRAEGELSAYLRVVTYRLLLDRRTKTWGKWRPSKRARGLGAAGIHLERLLVRDRLAPREAMRVLVEHPEFGLKSADAYSLYEALDIRQRPMEVELGSDPAGAQFAVCADPCDARELTARARRVGDALRRAIDGLDARDRQLLRYRFRAGRSVAEVSRALAVDQKSLYRQYERIFRGLRASVEALGVCAEDVQMIVGHTRVLLRTAIPDQSSTAGAHAVPRAPGA
jgi:RNA polymerase sigma factor (sigma-70 family)